MSEAFPPAPGSGAPDPETGPGPAPERPAQPWPDQPPPPPARPLRGPAPGLEYAGFGIRLVALIIDGIILAIVQGAVGSILGLGFVGYYAVDPAGPFAFRFGIQWLVYALVAAVVSGGYFVYTWTNGAASPGQRIMSLQVRNLSDGAVLTQDQAIRRWAFLTLPVVNAIPLLGLLVLVYNLYLAYTTATDPRNQGFHDKQVNSVVVRRVA